ncbi:MAG: hypothetical protein QXU40_03175 [Candidatus Pacearchaeota archaeon]
MSQIRAKQIKLNNQGDLIIGNSQGNGSILSIGTYGQNLQVAGSSVSWQWQQTLYDGSGIIVADTEPSPGGVNYITFEAGTSGSGPIIGAKGFDVNIDLVLMPAGTGEILAPVGYTANIVSNNALVNKEYVDSAVAGLDWKNSVRVATTSSAELSSYNYNVSAEPNGLVWTGVSGTVVIDGITLANGDRILIKNASDPRGNGIFYYDALNEAFVRTEDANNTPGNEFSGGLAVYVEEGTNNGATAWLVVSPSNTANLGVDNISFSQFIGTNLYVAGSGLSLTGNVFSINESPTIGVFSGNVGVKSSIVSNQVLLSQGNVNSPAIWGALPLNDSNAVTGVLNVQNGGTGLNNIPSNNIIVGTGTSSLSTISAIPSNSEIGYVLRSNISGDVIFGSISIRELSDVVFSSTPSPGDILRYDGTNWVLASAEVTDRLVAVNSASTPGHLKDVLVAHVSGAINFVSAGNTLVASVKYDNYSIIIVSGNIAVGGGFSNQVLLGTSALGYAVWGYLDSLYNANGSALFTVTGSGSNTLSYDAYTNTLSFNVSSIAIGSIYVSTNNLYLNSSGEIYLNNVRMPGSAPAHSVLIANTNNNVTSLTTGGNEDRYLVYKASSSALVFVSANEFGLGNFFGVISLSGNFNGDTSVNATQVNDTLTLVGGNAIRLTGNALSRNISITFANVNMSSVPVAYDDKVVFFDTSNTDKPEHRTFKGVFNDLNVPHNLSALGFAVQVSANEWVSRSIVASTSSDRVGIEIVNGNGVGGNPTVGLNIEGLSQVTTFSADNTYLVAYRGSNDTNVRISVEDVINIVDKTRIYDSSNTTYVDVDEISGRPVIYSVGQRVAVFEGLSTAASASRFFNFNVGSSADSIRIEASGTTTDINIRLVPKGTGSVIIGDTTDDGIIQADPGRNLLLRGGDGGGRVEIVPGSAGGQVIIRNDTSAKLVTFGNNFVRHHSLNDNSYKDEYVIRLSVSTSGGSDSYEIPLQTSSVMMLEGHVVGFGSNPNGIIGYKVESVLYRLGSNAGIVDSTVHTIIAASGHNMSVDITTSGTNAKFTVTSDSPASFTAFLRSTVVR